MGDARGAWFTFVEDRVAATSRILTQLKSIKVVGLEARVSTYLQLLRRAETKSSFRERHLRVVIHFLGIFHGTSKTYIKRLLTSPFRLGH